MTGSGTSARQYALRLLSYRDRSERELRDRLAKKGFNEDIIGAAIAQLRDAGLIDDRAFALSLCRQARENKLLGHNGVRLYLLTKGISRALVDEVTDYDEEQEIVTIRKLIRKKYRHVASPAPADIKRLRSFLLRKGYAPDVIRRALRIPLSTREDE